MSSLKTSFVSVMHEGRSSGVKIFVALIGGWKMDYVNPHKAVQIVSDT